MRLTITLPDDLAAAVEELRGQRLADAMREGYRREAEEPSLDEEWTVIETDGWP